MELPVLLIISIIGGVLSIVTLTCPTEEHPKELVTVKVYVVLPIGFAIGFAILSSDKPVEGIQLYVYPATGAEPICAPFALVIQVIS